MMSYSEKDYIDVSGLTIAKALSGLTIGVK